MLEQFIAFLKQDDKSTNTISSYKHHVQGFLNWYTDSFGEDSKRLFRSNILDYKAYLQNIKKDAARTINAKLSALIKYNEFLAEQGIQNDIVIRRQDMIKIQVDMASPADVSKEDLEAFRQKILMNESKRDYAIVTIMAYAGLRISEALDLQINDINLSAKEIVVHHGKGGKQRLVYMNDKILNALKEYLQERVDVESSYVFVSRQSERVNRSRINQIFNKHSDTITPHKLRHFYCSNAIESGYSINEVANQAGHSNIHTTLLYTNPSRDKMKAKANLL